MVEIDARKLECPKPVLLTKAETDKGTEEPRERKSFACRSTTRSPSAT